MIDDKLDKLIKEYEKEIDELIQMANAAKGKPWHARNLHTQTLHIFGIAKKISILEELKDEEE